MNEMSDAASSVVATALREWAKDFDNQQIASKLRKIYETRLGDYNSEERAILRIACDRLKNSPEGGVT